MTERTERQESRPVQTGRANRGNGTDGVDGPAGGGGLNGVGDARPGDLGSADAQDPDRADQGEERRGPISSVQSVDRAVSVLEVLAKHGEAGVTEIADELGVHKSTAFRLVGALENRGLVDQEKERGKYYLGAGVLRLAGAAAIRLDISQESAPICRRLADEVGETSNLAVLDGDAVVNIMQARGTAAVTAHNWLGRRTPLHATASGKVLLAHLPEPARDGVLARKQARFTASTVTSAEELGEQLEEVLRRGYATATEELEEGLNAVAAPVRAHDGGVVGAIGVSGPVYRMGEEQLPKLAETTVAAAGELSRRMGFGG